MRREAGEAEGAEGIGGGGGRGGGLLVIRPGDSTGLVVQGYHQAPTIVMGIFIDALLPPIGKGIDMTSIRLKRHQWPWFSGNFLYL